VFAGIVEDGGRTEIDQFDNVVGCHDAIIEFEIPVGETHLVEVIDTINDLSEDTVDFGSSHFTRHDHRE
jgi:hypothetical protein